MPCSRTAIEHVGVKLDAPEGGRGLKGVVERDGLAPGVQYVAGNLAAREMMRKGNAQITLHDLRQRRRQDAGALVVVALPGKLLAFDQYHVDVSARLRGEALERKAAGRSGGSAADDDDSSAVGQLA